MDFSRAPTLTTDRLTLREYAAADFEAFATLYSSPRSKFADGPVSRSTAWTRFSAGIGRWPLVAYGAWAVDRKSDEACVGVVSLNHPIGEHEERELGWLLWEEFEGNGYAVEAAAEAKRFAFKVQRFSTLVSYIDKDNDQSIRLAEKLGATIDATATRLADERTLVFRHEPYGAVLERI